MLAFDADVLGLKSLAADFARHLFFSGRSRERAARLRSRGRDGRSLYGCDLANNLVELYTPGVWDTPAVR